MTAFKIWVRSTGAPVKRPHPETKTKPPIGSTPVQVVDSVHYRQLINHPDEPLVLCDPPARPKPAAPKTAKTETQKADQAMPGTDKTKTAKPTGKE